MVAIPPEQQQKMLAFMKGYEAEHGVPAKNHQIMKHMGWKSHVFLHAALKAVRSRVAPVGNDWRVV